MKNTSWVVGQLQKRFTFKRDYKINCREVGSESTTEYYDTEFKGKGLEVKVTYDHSGHWTEFEVETRTEGSEDWNWLDSWEAYIR